MKTKRKTPDIRFRGFSDDWEQRKLANGTEKIGDGLHGTPQYDDKGTIAFINGNNLVDGKIVINKQTKFVTESQQSEDDKQLNTETILLSINGTIGNLARYSNEKVMLGKSVAYIEVSAFNKEFIYYLLQTPDIMRYFLSNLTGTTIKNLGLKTIRETPAIIPNIEEQTQIGTFFQSLDNLITLHQRKLQQLKEVKRGMLLKMFAEKTKSKPSVRLSGFDGLWEQTRYNAIVNYESSSFSRNEFSDEISETGYPVFDANNLVARIGQYDQGNNYISILKDGAGVGRLSLREGKSSVIGTMGYIVPKEVDVYFLYYLTKNIKFTKYINGSTIPHLYFKDYGEEKVKFAKDLKEQEEVGRFFQKLDRVIELQEREIELLEETKKGFLQKMFV